MYIAIGEDGLEPINSRTRSEQDRTMSQADHHFFLIVTDTI